MNTVQKLNFILLFNLLSSNMLFGIELDTTQKEINYCRTHITELKMNFEKSDAIKRREIRVQTKATGTDGNLVNGKNMKVNKKHNSYSREEDESAAKQGNSRIIPLKGHTENRREVRKEKKSRAGSYGPKLELDDRIFITVNSISRFIKVSDIQCIKAEKDYTYICTVDDKKLLVLRPMIEWEERLPVKYFARIHRSTIVNLELIEKVEKWFNYSYHVYLKNVDEPFQMSRRYALKLKERFR